MERKVPAMGPAAKKARRAGAGPSSGTLKPPKDVTPRKPGGGSLSQIRKQRSSLQPFSLSVQNGGLDFMLLLTTC